MNITELQTLYRKRTIGEIQAQAEAERLQHQLDATSQMLDNTLMLLDNERRRCRRQAQQINQLVPVIEKTDGYLNFIIERTWSENASALDMVMAYIASLEEVE